MAVSRKGKNAAMGMGVGTDRQGLPLAWLLVERVKIMLPDDRAKV